MKQRSTRQTSYKRTFISENDDIRDNIPFSKSLSLNEKLDANQSFPLLPHLIVANQRRFWQQLFSLSSKTDCSQSAEDIVFPNPKPDCITSDHPLNIDPECFLSSSIPTNRER